MTLHPPPTPADEAARVEAVRALELVGRPQEERFARIARIAVRATGMPLAYVSLIDETTWWAVACVGADGRTLPRDEAMCSFAISGSEPLVIPDLRADARFADHPLVTPQDGLQAYWGMPIAAPSGHRVGTVCVLDRRPRVPAPDDLEVLRDLGALAEVELATSDLERALEGRRAAEQRLRAVLDAADEGVLVISADFEVLDANPRAGAVLGLARDAMVGRPVGEVVRPLDASSADAVVTAVMRLHEEARGRTTVQRHDGTPVHVEFRTANLEPHGAGVVVTFHDVAAHAALDAARDAFVAGTSHELRTPMTSILGFTELLEARDDLPADAVRHVAAVGRGARRLAGLADGLLDRATGAAAARGAHAAPVDLRALADGLAEELAPADGRVTIAVHGEPLVVHGDADRLAGAVRNLVANAVKFSPPDRAARVDVEVRDDGEEVVLSVRDEGPGVPAAELPFLGRRFFRATTAKAMPGTGLGLSFAREVAEQHGGALEVQSEVGRGSTFGLRLPRTRTALT